VNPVLRGSAAHVFVESLLAPHLTGEDDHHLRRVLRIRDSDTVTLSDGVGSWVTARLTADGLTVTSAPISDHEPQPSVILSAIPKADRPEWMVQKLTELGATAIGFIECARSVVRWEEARADRQMERLRRIARESAMQSRRVWLPRLLEVVPFEQAAASSTCAIADPDGGPLTDDIDTIMVGPEGGFTDGELESVPRRVTLSPSVLRVETAALAATILLTQRAQKT
jgi:16S rRNA (uracil1498-N3)-methyltransferase